MISFCESVSLSREKFSDFDLISAQADMNKVYLAGYYTDEEGEKVNIQIPAGYFLQTNPDPSVSDLKPEAETPALTILDRYYKDEPIKLIRLNYVPGHTFYQFNKIDDTLYSTVNDQRYFCIKIAAQAPLGQEYKLYFANVPANRGLLLFSQTNILVKQDTPIEVFMHTGTEQTHDYFIHLIQLIDPNKDDGSFVTRVLSVTNVGSQVEDKIYLTFTPHP